MPHAVAVEGLLPRTLYPDRPASEHGGEPGAERLVERVLLVAEAAAYVGFYYAHVAPRPTQRLPHDAPHDVRYLRRGHDRDALAFHISPAVVVLDVAVLHRRSVVPALDFYEARFLCRGLIVSPAYARVAKDIVLELLVQLRCTLEHRLLRVENEGQVLVLDLYLPERLRRRQLVRGHDDSHIVAPESHVVGEQQPVGHVLMLRLRRPWVPRRREVVLRHVKAGEHRLDALHLPRPARIYRLHQRVRALGVQYLCRQRVLIAQVGRVFRAARRLVLRVHARHPLSAVTQVAASFHSLYYKPAPALPQVLSPCLTRCPVFYILTFGGHSEWAHRI